MKARINKMPFMVIVSIVILVMAGIITFCGNRHITIKANRIEKVEKVSSTEGEVSTEVYYLLFTDKGTYTINISGIFSRPEILGRIKGDSIYKIETIGLDIPFMGIYPSVLSIE